MTIPDNYNIWEAYDRMRSRWEKTRPICAKCHEYITGEIMDIFNVQYCEDCYEDLMREEGYDDDF